MTNPLYCFAQLINPHPWNAPMQYSMAICTYHLQIFHFAFGIFAHLGNRILIMMCFNKSFSAFSILGCKVETADFAKQLPTMLILKFFLCQFNQSATALIGCMRYIFFVTF